MVTNRELKKFGLTMAIAFFVLSAVLCLRDKSLWLFFAGTAGFFWILSLCAPGLLKYIYSPWMRFSHILGWLNTRLILLFIYYFIFTPIGLGLKLFQKDPLDRKIEKDKFSCGERGRTTFWRKKEKKALGLAQYERQF